MPENSMSEPGWKEKEGAQAMSIKESFLKAVRGQTSSLRDPCLFGHLPMAQDLRAYRF